MAAKMDFTKFDDVFLGILQNVGKIEPFLEAIFYFLARRTDFFKLMHNRDDKMGFPPGVAEKIVMNIFKKYQDMVLGNDPKHKQTGTTKGNKDKKPEMEKTCDLSDKQNVIPEAVGEIEVETEKEKDSTDRKNQSKMDDLKVETENNRMEVVDKPNSTKSPESSAENKALLSHDPDSYNGAATDKYTWSQTATDVDVKIPIPKFVRKSKDIEVHITHDRIKVSLRQDPPADSGMTRRLIIDGKLTQKVKAGESLWSIVPGESVQISLEKMKDTYWTALLEGEIEIDKTKLDTTRDITEFDVQTQADFQKVMFDHHQKMQGKPTSGEQKTHDLLKQAWDAEGSPFKGTPFDLSRVNISSGNG